MAAEQTTPIFSGLKRQPFYYVFMVSELAFHESTGYPWSLRGQE